MRNVSLYSGLETFIQTSMGMVLISGCTPTFLMNQNLNSPPFSVSMKAYPFLYASDGSGNVEQVSLNASTGALSSLTPSFIPSTGNSVSVAVSPNGKWLYTADQQTGISEFALDSKTGLLTNIGTYSMIAPQNVWVHPNSKWLYVSSWDTNSVYQFAIDPITGLLSPLSPASISAVMNPQFVAVEPSGNYAYEVNNSGYSISQYSVDPSAGVLSNLSPSTVASGRYVATLGFDPTGKYAYALDNTLNKVWQYSIQANGQLLALSPSSLNTGSSPRQIAFATLGSGTYAYITNFGSNTISMYSASSGVLTSIGTTVAVPGGKNYGIVVDPSNQWAFVVENGLNTIAQYTIDPSTGVLTLANAYSATTQSLPYVLSLIQLYH